MGLWDSGVGGRFEGFRTLGLGKRDLGLWLASPRRDKTRTWQILSPRP